MLTLWAQAQIAGPSIVGFRLFDLAVHFGCAALFCRWLIREGTSSLLAHCLTALFLVHPSTTEAVMWVTGGRNDSMGTLFALAALLCFRAEAPSWPRAAGATVFVLAATLCKEVFVVLPFLLISFTAVRARGDLARRISVPVGLPLLGDALFFLLRHELHISSVSRALDASLGEHATNYASILWHYAFQILAFDNGPTTEHFVPLRPVYAALVLTCVIAVTLACVRSRSFALFGWLWFLSALAPHVISLPVIGQWGNRYAYFAGLGLAAMIAFVLPAVAKRLPPNAPKLAAGTTFVLVVLLAIRTSMDASLWRDGVTLFGADVARNPDDGRAHYHLGVELLAHGGCVAALPHFTRSTELEPTYARAWHNVAGCLIQLRRPRDALEPAERDVALEPTNPRSQYNDAVALFASGDRAAGLRSLSTALTLDPHYRQAELLRDKVTRASAAGL
jgi:tetratricopeptide (TPR) repeat protein